MKILNTIVIVMVLLSISIGASTSETIPGDMDDFTDGASEWASTTFDSGISDSNDGILCVANEYETSISAERYWIGDALDLGNMEYMIITIKVWDNQQSMMGDTWHLLISLQCEYMGGETKNYKQIYGTDEELNRVDWVIPLSDFEESEGFNGNAVKSVVIFTLGNNDPNNNTNSKLWFDKLHFWDGNKTNGDGNGDGNGGEEEITGFPYWFLTFIAIIIAIILIIYFVTKRKK